MLRTEDEVGKAILAPYYFIYISVLKKLHSATARCDALASAASTGSLVSLRIRTKELGFTLGVRRLATVKLPYQSMWREQDYSKKREVGQRLWLRFFGSKRVGRRARFSSDSSQN